MTDTATIDETAEREALLTYLAGIGIVAPIVPYPAHTSIDEGKRLRGDLPGVFTKNLLLKDKKGNLFFVTAHEDTEIDLKTLHTRIDARGRLGFAAAHVMAELLHVTPGTATPLALRHDTAPQIALVVDERLEGAAQVNFHPMTHTESIGLTWKGFRTFADTTGHPPLLTTMN
ncbi:DNA-binding protein [Intrasporangium chromatireducens Q5-1]|uniref:DNA-binding protein n=1 Tax=Intrasporangium chromatireducens Q5-1 TaxID=584657 RepID=W9GM20_9MICO|nr:MULTISPECIES: YbaK/EbsC family protein [Actinomycetes]EWT07130.1 DNA-binding protein [Intrasporangium chromatireducens Q5-1]